MTFTRSIVLAALLGTASVPAQIGYTKAEEFARQQDFSTSPPTLDSYLSHILWYARPNGSYEHTGGTPWPSPGPWFLPADLWSYTVRCKTDTEQTSSSPLCIKKTSTCYVWLTFSDGSDYTFEELTVATTCSDGTSELFRKQYHVADAGPPADRDALILVQSWTSEVVETVKRYYRGKSGAVASFTGGNGIAVVSGGPLEFDLGPGAVLDLQQNPAVNGPLFVTDTPATLRCDTVLLDPGVTLADLFVPPPIVMPASNVVEVEAPAVHLENVRPGGTAPNPAIYFVTNTGNQNAIVTVSWQGPWVAPGQAIVNVPVGQRRSVAIPYTIPGGTPLGTRSEIDLQVNLVGMSIYSTAIVFYGHAGVTPLGSGTPGCLGAHPVTHDDALVAGGAPLTMTVGNNNPNGIGLWAFGSALPDYAPLHMPVPVPLPPGLLELHLDPASALLELYVCDNTGTGSFVLSAPADPNLQGVNLVCQPIGLWLGPCSPGVLTFSSGPGLLLEIQ